MQPAQEGMVAEVPEVARRGAHGCTAVGDRPTIPDARVSGRVETEGTAASSYRWKDRLSGRPGGIPLTAFYFILPSCFEESEG